MLLSLLGVPVTLEKALSAPRLGRYEFLPYIRTSTIFTSHMLGHLVVRMSRKHNWYVYALMGTVDRRGYDGQQKGTICDARGPYPSI